ncbi:MAG: YchJ family metal-binding protein [Gammaproteobacteria bacterium]|nr:YchJ family metal-binding protein [Gammaproteobacteria bacterium]MDH5594608.1 YchJ family metal-binding protein [Gammaproteobacteria bacterium]MDH5614662.1 YchJ family metal-binding protein [Gammaproteobacteria bacterium]
MAKTNPCPCGSNKEFTDCCACYIHGDETAPTAETLMRSRYTAYTLLNEAYILKTWHESTRPDTLAMAQDQFIKWTGLTVKYTEKGGIDDNEGIVEFVARYKLNGKAEKIHEVSQFEKHNGQWLYVKEKAG